MPTGRRREEEMTTRREDDIVRHEDGSWLQQKAEIWKGMEEAGMEEVRSWDLDMESTYWLCGVVLTVFAVHRRFYG
ncbi:unnamed protein product [Linum trigynum]|uniref:Uncharacterized protein n=1 Tax=Linum trigynum TaxID=586398 RepID=A0AAV2EHK2_9ROSI